tara:strand:- start:29 stop:145 length:117 start_codon:yes stop_codon:yes gene_type:complete
MAEPLSYIHRTGHDGAMPIARSVLQRRPFSAASRAASF